MQQEKHILWRLLRSYAKNKALLGQEKSHTQEKTDTLIFTF